MIISLQLENFRKHKKLDVNFTAGLNGVFGPNYTGKTTILYGILFCLGGITSVPCKAVIRSGCTTFSAAMRFSIAGKLYGILRTKSTDKLFEIVDGEEVMIANGAKVVNKEIEKLLGMTMARFCQIRYSRQKFTSALLTLGATELHNILSDVSGADFVQRVLERLGDMKKKLEWSKEGKEVVDLSALEAQFNTATATVVELSTAVANAKESRKAAVDCVESIRASLKDLNAGRVEWEKYLSTKTSLQSQVVNAEAALKEIKPDTSKSSAKKMSVEAVKAKMEKAISDFDADKERFRSAKQESEKEERLTIRFEAEDKSVKRAEADLAEALVAVSKLSVPATESQEAELQEKIEVLTTAMRESSALHADLEKGICTGCNRPLHEGVTVEELEAKKQVALETYQFSKKEKAALAEELETFTTPRLASQKLLDKADTAVSAAAARLEAVKADHALAAKELQDFIKTRKFPAWSEADIANLDSQQEKISELKIFVEKESRQAELVKAANAKLDKAVNDLETLLNSAPKTVTAEAVEMKEDALTAATEALESITTHWRECEDKLRDANQEFRSLEMAISTGKATNEELSKVVSKLAAVTALQKFLKDNKDEYMREVWAALMADATQLVSAATSGDISSLERTEDGKFAYTEEGQSFNVSEASGAQAAIMGLAVQTALARALPPVLDVLLVDEPTADMDDERSLAFAMLLPTRAAQVICISHSRMDSSMCTNVIDLEEMV